MARPSPVIWSVHRVAPVVYTMAHGDQTWASFIYLWRKLRKEDINIPAFHDDESIRQHAVPAPLCRAVERHVLHLGQ
jgi:hypothetical protein